MRIKTDTRFYWREILFWGLIGGLWASMLWLTGCMGAITTKNVNAHWSIADLRVGDSARQCIFELVGATEKTAAPVKPEVVAETKPEPAGKAK